VGDEQNSHRPSVAVAAEQGYSSGIAAEFGRVNEKITSYAVGGL